MYATEKTDMVSDLLDFMANKFGVDAKHLVVTLREDSQDSLAWSALFDVAEEGGVTEFPVDWFGGVLNVPAAVARKIIK